MQRSNILAEANSLICNDRQDDYGDAKDMFECIAYMWEAYLNPKEGISISIAPQDVAMMMCLLKIARSTASPQKADSYVDLCGYAALAAELAQAE
jgi:hypothetical protein